MLVFGALETHMRPSSVRNKRELHTRAQFHRAAKQPIIYLLYIFHFIALLTVRQRERHTNLPAEIASK